MKKSGSKIWHRVGDVLINGLATSMIIPFRCLSPNALIPFERFLLKIDISGEEYLRSALAQKKGVIALGIHLGPFTLVGARLSLEGYRFNLIFNEGNYPKLWKRLGNFHRRLGQNPFPLKPTLSSLKKSLNCLRRNEILYLIADEQQRYGGIPIPFFGK